jgi:hypothetical protein
METLMKMRVRADHIAESGRPEAGGRALGAR